MPDDVCSFANHASSPPAKINSNAVKKIAKQTIKPARRRQRFSNESTSVRIAKCMDLRNAIPIPRKINHKNRNRLSSSTQNREWFKKYLNTTSAIRRMAIAAISSASAASSTKSARLLSLSERMGVLILKPQRFASAMTWSKNGFPSLRDHFS